MGAWVAFTVGVSGLRELVPSKSTDFSGWLLPIVNYCDIDFGFSDELPAGSCLFVPPDIGVSGGCPAGSPVTLRGAPPVPEPGRMDLLDGNESLGNQWSDSADAPPPSRRLGGRRDEAWKVEIQHVPAISGTAECGNGQLERFSRPGRINYRERTFYRGQRQNG